MEIGHWLSLLAWAVSLERMIYVEDTYLQWRMWHEP